MTGRKCGPKEEAMNTNKLRQLAATALAFAVALDSWEEGAAKVAEKMTAKAPSRLAKRAAKRAAKAPKAAKATVAAVAKPAKKAVKKRVKFGKPSVAGKPRETIDNTGAVMLAIAAGHTTKAAIVEATKASEGRVGLALIALRVSGRIAMRGSKRGASYAQVPSALQPTVLNFASAHAAE